MAHQVFISYSHVDKAIADALCHKLEEDSIRCWIAPRDIAPGSEWAESIAEAIPKSDVLILIFSSNSNKSKQVKREVEIAIDSDVVLIPMRIEETKPTGSMSYYLSTTHWIDAVGSKMEKHFNIISSRIQGLLGLNGTEKKEYEDAAETAGIEKKKRHKPENKIAKKKSKSIALRIFAAAIVIGLIATGVILGMRQQDTLGTQQQEVPNTQTAVDAGPSNAIKFEDEVMEAAIRDTLEDMGVTTGESITIEDMKKLTYLKIASQSQAEALSEEFADVSSGMIITPWDISSLSGLEYAENLETLVIAGKGLTDISSLEKLTKLKVLILDDNNINDISAISSAAYLETLHLKSNQIVDISPIKDFNHLSELKLDNNRISDVSVISNLNYLSSLSLSNNSISDISPLSSLKRIVKLDLSANTISKIDALEGYAILEELNLSRNLIDGSNVFTNLTSLKELNVSNNNFVDLSTLVNLKLLKKLGYSKVAAFATGNYEYLLSMSQLDELILDSETYIKYISIFFELKGNGCSIELSDAAEDIEDKQKKKPEDYGYNPDDEVNIEDETLEQGIFRTLNGMGKKTEGKLSVAEMFELEYLILCPREYFSEITEYFLFDDLKYMSDKIIVCTDIDGIGSLEGLQYAHNLKTLIILDHKISDLAPLAELSDIEILVLGYLTNRHMENMDVLAGLKNMRVIFMSGDAIEDLDFMSELGKLENIYIEGYNIKDISPIVYLPNVILAFFNNCINVSNWDKLSNSPFLSHCEWLSLHGNNLNGLKVFEDADNLKMLIISDTKNADIQSGASDAVLLQSLNIEFSDIKDISSLPNLMSLDFLSLDSALAEANAEIINELEGNGCEIYLH
ncbi:MAG: leucine-rich repeat domain-containing protein [Clostridia bacterium]|nr:leucine-rich repeat domain-containing protein [Clostridia bacterium]